MRERGSDPSLARRANSTSSAVNSVLGRVVMAAGEVDLSKIRNLGVIAHIDAGKTTTTEHLLYYAGAKHKLGGVDEGTTETDYDVEEQQRGITIYSACIPFQWREDAAQPLQTPRPAGVSTEEPR